MSGQENACKLEVNMYLSLAYDLKKKKAANVWWEIMCAFPALAHSLLTQL